MALVSPETKVSLQLKAQKSFDQNRIKISQEYDAIGRPRTSQGGAVRLRDRNARANSSFTTNQSAGVFKVEIKNKPSQRKSTKLDPQKLRLHMHDQIDRVRA